MRSANPPALPNQRGSTPQNKDGGLLDSWPVTLPHPPVFPKALLVMQVPYRHRSRSQEALAKGPGGSLNPTVSRISWLSTAGFSVVVKTLVSRSRSDLKSHRRT